jgi:uncharacterized membrane protein
VTTSFTLTVINQTAPSTKPPVITTKNVLTAYAGEYYSVNYTAVDPDTPQNQLVWTMTTNATWLNFSKNRVLFGTPNSTDIGSYCVKITVSDGKLNDTTQFTITVYANSTHPTPSGAPEVTSTNVESEHGNASLNSSELVIKFSESMNTSSVEDALYITSGINYTLTWNKNETELTITFTDTLAPNTKIKVTINTSAKDDDGNNLDSALNLEFITKFGTTNDDGDSTGDGKSGEGTEKSTWRNLGLFGIVSVVILIIFIALYTVILKNRKKGIESSDHNMHEDKTTGLVELEKEADYANDVVPPNGTDGFVKKLADETFVPRKPTDFSISKEKMLDSVREKYEKGELTKETYDEIRERLNKPRQ